MERGKLWRTVVLASCGLVIGTGCARRAEVTLHQPNLPQVSQREQHLKGSSAYFSVCGDRQVLLLMFPRPTAQYASKDFLLYATAPEGTGVFTLAGGGGAGARGFLIQAVGEWQGRANFVNGSLKVRRVAFSPDVRRVDLALRCEDGTTVDGYAYAARSDVELSHFEDQHAADVALLDDSGVRTASDEDATGPRGAQRASNP